MTERAGVPDHGAASYARAVALLDALAAAGVCEVVLSPGSRSTPLALAAARCASLRVHVVPDERSAAFFALGLARAHGLPAAVIATSGSAPAHWLPAAIEASEDAQPLLLLSADRPAELLGCGANQATEQGRLFAAHARASFALAADAGTGYAQDIGRRAGAACRWPRPGPVHINVAFREPLVAVDPASCGAWTPGSAAIHPPSGIRPDLAAVAALAARLSDRRGAILAGRLPPGDPAASAAVQLANTLDCPLIADPLSGLRSGDHGATRILCAADAFLRTPAAPTPDWLIRFGLPPVSRYLEEWTARAPETILLASTPDWADPLRQAQTVLLGDPSASLSVLAAAAMRAGLRAAPWDALDQLERAANTALSELPAPPAEATLVQALAAALPAGTPVFVSNSLVVRDFDSFLPRRTAELPLFGNRGVSGIDGNLSTAAGIVKAADRPGLAVLGDLALFHDLNALALCRGLPLVIVVVNNGGGAIFGGLPQAALPEFERLWLTAPELDLGRAAALFDLDHAALDASSDLEQTLESALATAARDHRPVLLEFAVDRGASQAGREAWWSAVARAGLAEGET